jgi:hypothetical protein
MWHERCVWRPARCRKQAAQERIGFPMTISNAHELKNEAEPRDVGGEAREDASDEKTLVPAEHASFGMKIRSGVKAGPALCHYGPA